MQGAPWSWPRLQSSGDVALSFTVGDVCGWLVCLPGSRSCYRLGFVTTGAGYTKQFNMCQLQWDKGATSYLWCGLSAMLSSHVSEECRGRCSFLYPFN